jgi:RNA polymerase sigma-70 factor (ECF subfamily)
MSQLPHDTLALLRSAKAGDKRSLDALLARYQGRLLDRIRLMMGAQARDAAESSDFLQETLLDVARSFDGIAIQDEGQLLRWMTEVARNNIRDEVRRPRERSFDTFSSLLLAGGAPAIAEPTPPSDAARREELHQMAECLERLPEDHRQVLELRHFEGLHFEEIGRRMGRSPNAVQLLHTRALVRLGALLGD